MFKILLFVQLLFLYCWNSFELILSGCFLMEGHKNFKQAILLPSTLLLRPLRLKITIFKLSIGSLPQQRKIIIILKYYLSCSGAVFITYLSSYKYITTEIQPVIYDQSNRNTLDQLKYSEPTNKPCFNLLTGKRRSAVIAPPGLIYWDFLTDVWSARNNRARVLHKSADPFFSVWSSASFLKFNSCDCFGMNL